MKCFMMLWPRSSPISPPPLYKHLDYKYYMRPVPNLLQTPRLSSVELCLPRGEIELSDETREQEFMGAADTVGSSPICSQYTSFLCIWRDSWCPPLPFHLSAPLGLCSQGDPAVLGARTSRGSPQTVTDQIWRTHTPAFVNPTACSVLSLRGPRQD